MVEFVFLDLDDTIFDFHKAEQIALCNTLQRFGVEPTDETVARYSQINQQHWQMLERGEIIRAQVRVRRFAVLFAELGNTADPQACSDYYVQQLSIGHYYLPGAHEAVKRLAKKYRLYLASNGGASVQASRLSGTDLHLYFEKIFISEELGADKPSEAFFDRCFAQIPGFEKEKAIMVGDSLTSDILGGIRAGLTTCWVNPKHKPGNPQILPDYEIEALPQLEALLEKL